jgi:hypothetical protein
LAIGWKGSWLFRAFADCNTDESREEPLRALLLSQKSHLGWQGGRKKECELCSLKASAAFYRLGGSTWKSMTGARPGKSMADTHHEGA